ncbi:glycoside hydrolase superfamily [Aspergillus cavernicola]|uniref:Glycoside hydrolase superfamily n=1 Tax=Aspergillus cavernicola TaxID=176166 RepID=A0ABR4J0R3_9EURO
MPNQTYPRPDFYRKSLTWTSLNGPWSFLFDDSNSGLTQQWPSTGLPDNVDTGHKKREITVPYAFQTPASGINLQEAHEVIWYERVITDVRSADDVSAGHRLLLRFGAVDYECTIWIEGQEVGSHRGGQVPFDLDITDSFPVGQQGGGSTSTSARVTIRVRDSPTDLTQPRGKQYWGPVPESIFYTPTSGIWQNVWMEVVPRLRIKDSSEGTVLIPDVGKGRLEGKIAVTGSGSGGFGQADDRPRNTVSIGAYLAGVLVGREVVEIPLDQDVVAVSVDMRVTEGSGVRREGILGAEGVWRDSVALWAPEHPVLYDLVLQVTGPDGKVVDEVQTTVGMRSISWENGDGTFRLNGKPYFQALVLDQGYWPETGLTPPSSEALKTDIELAKKVGLNGCRKHQKVEDPIFLYWADRLGYLVWGEIGNAYEFSDEYIKRFSDEWSHVVKRDRNHPCVVAWTPVNESWAYKNLKDNIDERNHIRSLYSVTKALDSTRPINDNCGWEHVQTDLTTYHDYSDSAELADICSKMDGGILARKGHGEMFLDPISSGSTVLDPGSKHKPGAPVICSEFGGVNIAPAKDAQASARDWGYTTAADPNDLLARLEKLFMAVVRGGHTCGFVYTQLTDIEQEVNGLYSYDRREKVAADRIKALMDAAKEYYYKNILSSA